MGKHHHARLVDGKFGPGLVLNDTIPEGAIVTTQLRVHLKPEARDLLTELHKIEYFLGRDRGHVRTEEAYHDRVIDLPTKQIDEKPTIRIIERDSAGGASDPVQVVANTVVMGAGPAIVDSDGDGYANHVDRWPYDSRFH